MVRIQSNVISEQIARDLSGLERSHRAQLLKVSSAKRITTSGDDAGGLSLALKHASASKRLRAAWANLQNAKSYARTQDGVLANVAAVYSRMEELAVMATDSTKTDAERTLYDKEFQELRDSVVRMSLEKFNELRLFRGKQYELVDKGAWTNWDAAKAEVDALDATDADNTHYLATITSEKEQYEINLQLGSSANKINVWLGGRDAVDPADPDNHAAINPAEEGKWRWTEGPEGEEDGGMGRLFWDGASNGTPVNDAFANWAPNVTVDADGVARVRDPKKRQEPNNSGGEHFLQISQRPGWFGTEPGDEGVGGWNDLRNSTPRNSTYGVQGYLMETDEGGLKVNVGANGESFTLANVDFEKYLDDSLLNVLTVEDAQAAIGELKIAVEDVADARAQVGANLARIEKELEQTQAFGDGYEAARSAAEDLDVALASLRLSKQSSKLQSNMALLAQANKLTNVNWVEILLE